MSQTHAMAARPAAIVLVEMTDGDQRMAVDDKVRRGRVALTFFAWRRAFPRGGNLVSEVGKSLQILGTCNHGRTPQLAGNSVQSQALAHQQNCYAAEPPAQPV